MPLQNIDWTAGRDPVTFLSEWASAVAAALTAGGVPAAATASVPRAQVAAALALPPAQPTFTAPARFTDRIDARVTAADGSVAAAVLFVTPDNKADSDSALAFAVRAAQLMSAGAGVVVVDALPGPASWATHLHSLTGVYPITKRPRGADAPVLAVQPTFKNGAEEFACWHHNVPVGAALPTVPLAVRGAMCLTIDLEATYAEAIARAKLA